MDKGRDLKNSKPKNVITIQHINIRSLQKNFIPIQNYLYDSKPHFLCLSETWLNNHITNVNIDGYNFINKDRSQKRGGGVAMYIKNDTCVEEININDEINDFEQIWISHKSKNSSFIIGTIYRPPNGNLTNFYMSMNHILIHILKKIGRCPVYILGDFNVDINKVSGSSKFLDLFEQLGFYQIIKEIQELQVDLKHN